MRLAPCSVLPLLLLLPACDGLSATAVPASSAPDAAPAPLPIDGRASIGLIQGRAARSPYAGQRVTIEGVVVGNFAKGLGGVFVQSEKDDGDAATSEGIFVEQAVNGSQVSLHTGDRVRVTGRVAELGDGEATLTALVEAQWQMTGRGQVRPVRIGHAPAQAADWERYEGMALQIAAPLTVSDTQALGRYGELTASFDGRIFQPTEIAAPGTPAQRLAEQNAARRLRLDDNRDSRDPRDLWFLPKPWSAEQPLRTGSRVSGVNGVLDQRHGDYRLQLTDKLRIEQAARPPAPKVPGDLRIASLNVLNLFNGDGHGGGFPTERGAESADQYHRQQQKLAMSVQALAPDVAALMEVENDGYGPDSALAQLVAAINRLGPIRDYAFVDAGQGPGEDQIRVALIYRQGRIKPQGAPVTLPGGPFAGRSRVPLAQAFRAGNGPVFVVAANHFKSKGCGRDENRAQGTDADQHDGQSCWNATRVESARRVNDWLAADPTHSGKAPVLLVGDLNAYAKEDPLRVLHEAGWQDAFALAKVAQPYSFVYDGQAGRLDHALLNAPMAQRLRGAAEWHNNSDEAERFDYHQDLGANPYRASDHDPVLLGFDLTR